MNAVAFWVFAVALAAFSAINERELRQRRADLEAVVRIGIQIEDEGDPVRQAAIVLDGLIGPYALARGLVIGADDDGLVVLGARGISVEPRTEIPLDPIVRRAWAEGRPITQSWLDRGTDPGLSWLMKNARRLIVAPMLADGRPVGAIVLERRYGQRPGLEQRTARVAAQVAAMTAVNVRNAVLLRRVRDVDERDPLTGAPNRRTFQASLQRAVWSGGKRGTRTSSVLFIDLDGLGAVNEAHGFAVGDALLVAVARRVESLIRDGDVFARLDGDEFAILTQDVPDLRRSRAMADRLVEELGAPFVLDDVTLSITASIGIAGADDAESAADLARNADVAMYMVKAGGRGGVAVFDPAMPTEIRERRELATELQQAVALDQLELRYQPIINLATNTMAGVEALVRWQHPERGLVAPGQFIQIAEEHGSILPIGRWVLREACRQAAAWAAEGVTAPGMTVAVNVSAREVQEAGFVDGVREALTDHGIGAGTLVIEIAEAALLRANATTVDALQGLRDLGVRVVIDDFGTGYFPLSHLRAVPGGRVEDRGRVHPGDRRRGRRPLVRPGRGDRRDGALAGHRDRGRRDRDGGAGRLDALAPVHLRPGLLLRPAAAARGPARGRADLRRSPRRGGRRGRGRRGDHPGAHPTAPDRRRQGRQGRRRREVGCEARSGEACSGPEAGRGTRPGRRDRSSATTHAPARRRARGREGRRLSSRGVHRRL